MKISSGILSIAVMALAAGFAMVPPVGPVSAQTGQREEARRAPSRPATAQIPEITRIAVIQDQGGERFLRSPLAIALDGKNGDLIVTSFESGEVVILDKNGVPLKRLGADSGLTSPYGVAIDARGRIYVSEIKSGLVKILSPAGSLLEEIDLSNAMGKTVSPGRLTLDKNGLLYVADLNNNEILIFNAQGKFVRSEGGFQYLQKAAAIDGDRIIGLSAQGKAVRVSTKDGAVLSSFGEHGDTADKNVSFPTGFAVDAKGRLWIADAFQHRLKVFALDGKFLFNFGRIEEKEGGFFFPVDICFDGKGRLFVAEKGANRVQVFLIGDLKE